MFIFLISFFFLVFRKKSWITTKNDKTLQRRSSNRLASTRLGFGIETMNRFFLFNSDKLFTIPSVLRKFDDTSWQFVYIWFLLMIVKLPDYYLVEIITQSVSWTKKYICSTCHFIFVDPMKIVIQAAGGAGAIFPLWFLADQLTLI